MSYLRTAEHRRRQSERIRVWRPWERSTGPRTAEGKAASSHNAWKGGNRPVLREVARVLSEQERMLEGQMLSTHSLRKLKHRQCIDAVYVLAEPCDE
jgi:hypothetical protein